MKYSFDSSAFINGWRKQFPPDIVPPLWNNLAELIKEGRLRAAEEVWEELGRKDDELAEWASQQPGLFVTIDEAIQVPLGKLVRKYPRLLDTRRNRSGADPWVIALAALNGWTVVTDEGPSGKLERPHIPDVCKDMSVPCINLLSVIRQEGWVFGGPA